MIPFTVARNNEIINFSQVCRIVQTAPGRVDVHFSNGDVIKYEGKSADIVKGQGKVYADMHQAYLAEMVSPIITAGNGKLN